jgi:hypothetical protein
MFNNREKLLIKLQVFLITYLNVSKLLPTLLNKFVFHFLYIRSIGYKIDLFIVVIIINL